MNYLMYHIYFKLYIKYNIWIEILLKETYSINNIVKIVNHNSIFKSKV